MKYGVLPKLTKDYVLSKISQADIFSKYTNLSSTYIDELAFSGGLIKSTIREDKTPTVGFKYGGGRRLRMKDFAGHFWGDCFDLVGQLIRENPSNKIGFYNILDAIAKDFNIHKYENGNYVKTISYAHTQNKPKVKDKILIQYEKRNWNKLDALYWTRFNITRKILQKFNVYPCQYIWVDGDLRYEYTANNPTYAYDYFDNGTELKIYYPFRRKFRFISNTSMLQGINLIKKDEFALITKSYKDVMTLDSFSIQSVAPSSETHLISVDDYEILKKNFYHLFSLMDYDRTGKLMAGKLRKIYDIKPLMVKYDAYGNLLNHTSKDLSDLVKEKGVAYTESLVEDTINFYADGLTF